MCYYTNLCAEVADWWSMWGVIIFAGIFIGIPALGVVYFFFHGANHVMENYVTPMCTANRQPYTARNRCNDVIYTSHKVTGKESAPFKVRQGDVFYIPKNVPQRERARR